MSIGHSFRSELRNRLDVRVRFDEPLKPYMAYRIGGPADVLVFPASEAELTWLSDQAAQNSVPITVVGTGTNLLVHDDGIRGIVILLENAFDQIEVVEHQAEAVLVRAGGGVTKPHFLDWACDNGLTGLEFSSGVPGTVGGGIYMNAGTKYGSYSDILTELRLFSFKNGPSCCRREELFFGYREQTAVKEAIVVSATFKLRKGDHNAIRREVQRIIAERAKKQPLDLPSCGSTFKNPPGFSAGRLIERCDLKGLRVGGAEISAKHANFILNTGDAMAADVLTLIDIATATVKYRTGVTLENEVILLGGSSF